MTRQDSISEVMNRRQKLSHILHGLNNDVAAPEEEESSFWFWHANIISQWVTESRFRDFFDSERQVNANAVQDLEEVLDGEQRVASEDENNHVHQEWNNRAMLQLKWTKLARECMNLARVFLPNSVSVPPFSA